MEKLLMILNELRPDVDFENAEGLIDNGILDSFDLVNLVGEINDTFDIELGVEDLLPDNFNDLRAIYALIQRLL